MAETAERKPVQSSPEKRTAPRRRCQTARQRFLFPKAGSQPRASPSLQPLKPRAESGGHGPPARPGPLRPAARRRPARGRPTFSRRPQRPRALPGAAGDSRATAPRPGPRAGPRADGGCGGRPAAAPRPPASRRHRDSGSHLPCPPSRRPPLHHGAAVIRPVSEEPLGARSRSPSPGLGGPVPKRRAARTAPGRNTAPPAPSSPAPPAPAHRSGAAPPHTGDALLLLAPPRSEPAASLPARTPGARHARRRRHPIAQPMARARHAQPATRHSLRRRGNRPANAAQLESRSGAGTTPSRHGLPANGPPRSPRRIS